VPKQDLAGGEDPAAHDRLPAASCGGHLDPADGIVDLCRDDVGDAVEDVLLLGHVVVMHR
jgi:hypothetical protein